MEPNNGESHEGKDLKIYLNECQLILRLQSASQKTHKLETGWPQHYEENASASHKTKHNNPIFQRQILGVHMFTITTVLCH